MENQNQVAFDIKSLLNSCEFLFHEQKYSLRFATQKGVVDLIFMELAKMTISNEHLFNSVDKNSEEFISGVKKLIETNSKVVNYCLIYNGIENYSSAKQAVIDTYVQEMSIYEEMWRLYSITSYTEIAAMKALQIKDCIEKQEKGLIADIDEKSIEGLKINKVQQIALNCLYSFYYMREIKKEIESSNLKNSKTN